MPRALNSAECSVTNTVSSLIQLLNSLKNMRIYKGLLLCQLSTASPPTTTSTTITSETTAMPTCDTGELTLPKNAKRWTCSDVGTNVPNNTKCFLDCEDGYAVENSKFCFERDEVDGKIKLKIQTFKDLN